MMMIKSDNMKVEYGGRARRVIGGEGGEGKRVEKVRGREGERAGRREGRLDETVEWVRERVAAQGVGGNGDLGQCEPEMAHSWQRGHASPSSLLPTPFRIIYQ